MDAERSKKLWNYSDDCLVPGEGTYLRKILIMNKAQIGVSDMLTADK